MTSQTTRRRILAAAGVVALLGLSATPASAHSHPHPPKPVDLQLLSFNDFHGHLEPPTGNDGTLLTSAGTTVPAGGSEYLTTDLRALRKGHRNTLTVAAGDLIGG